jgi:vacuolar iron transporter family protein
MVEWEHGFPSHRPNPLRGAVVTFAAFTTVGGIPLLGLGVAALPVGGSPFVWSAVFAGVAFALVGGLKGVAVDVPRWRSALETVLLGGAAATLAYAVGAALGRYL